MSFSLSLDFFDLTDSVLALRGAVTNIEQFLKHVLLGMLNIRLSYEESLAVELSRISMQFKEHNLY